MTVTGAPSPPTPNSWPPRQGMIERARRAKLCMSSQALIWETKIEKSVFDRKRCLPLTSLAFFSKRSCCSPAIPGGAFSRWPIIFARGLKPCLRNIRVYACAVGKDIENEMPTSNVFWSSPVIVRLPRSHLKVPTTHSTSSNMSGQEPTVPVTMPQSLAVDVS